MGTNCQAVIRWGLGCALALTAIAPPPAFADEIHSAPPLTLNLVLGEHRVPTLSATVMKRELARIWANEGVEIVWRESESQVPLGERFITLTVIDDVERPHRRQEKYVLGDFLSDEGRIRISLFAATQAAVKSTVTSRRTRDSFERPLALGYILGRAIAHEVGHALLGRAHTEWGLMSATFDPATMADAQSDEFRLVPAQSLGLTLTRLNLRAEAGTDTAPVSLELEADDDALAR